MSDWYARQSRITIDLIVIVLVGVPLYAAAMWFEVLHLIFKFTSDHHNHEYDWIIVLLFCIGIAATFFSTRRVIDLRREVKQRRHAEVTAHRPAHHDALTGLPNRRCFIEDFDRRAMRLEPGEVCALFVVDLDNFKPINDLYGHRLGDEVLRVVARRLSQIAGKDGVVARLGGDEFGVLMLCRKDDDVPARLAGRIVHAVPEPIELAALSLVVGVSVGVTVYDPEETREDTEFAAREGSLVETTLRRADMAMYRAKMEGPGLYRFFDRDMDAKLQQRIQLEGEIKDAIAQGEIVPYYQPLIDLETQATIGYEMLARWEHPTKGVLPPELFIPIAEDTGTIGELTYSLLARAVKDARNWPSHMVLSMNLSPRQFADSGLPQKLLGILAKEAFPPHRLEVEITETAAVQRLEEAKATLEALRNVGIRVALDDFGTGYAGLFHLRELKFDTIKIDRSFVTEMLDRPEEAKIVEAIIGLGRALGLQTTAEGIETKDVLDRLMTLGCETGQGYLFGTPARTAAGPPPRLTGLPPSAGRAPSPSAGPRAWAPTPPWRWSMCPA